MSSNESADFGKVAVALGFLTREDLAKALRFQEDLRRVGVEKRLGEILLEKKILSRQQVLLALRAQGKRILTCRECRKSYNVHNFRPGETYVCKHCMTPLQAPAPPVDTRVHDSVILDADAVQAALDRRKKRVPGHLVHLLPGYELMEQIGQGGMGSVYKARDLILGRWVAVKLLAPFLAEDEEYVKRFFIEAKHLQRLHHPNIVEAYDAGVASDQKFLIMEFVEGASLDHILDKHGKMPERKAMHIVRQVAGALDYAWHRKIIHRDVKPQNVILTPERIAKLCDLGLSKDVSMDLSLTMTGSINCSPPYASPEQGQGLKNLDCRTDTYSLGVMFFQMVVGELPFEAESPGEYLIKHVTKPPPDPTTRNPELSPQTGSMILKMLEKDPKHRPEPGDVARAITRHLHKTDGARK
jgi:serine/threonine-protein kinase